jgi:hypothetical protein
MSLEAQPASEPPYESTAYFGVNEGERTAGVV